MNSPMMLLVLFAAGFGYGYWMERAGQPAPQAVLSASRDPAWLKDFEPRYQNLVGIMKKKGFGIGEDPATCKRKELFGFYAWGQSQVKICTDRIAKFNSEPLTFRTLMQQTVAHEATHVAQSCRQLRDGKLGLGLPAVRLYGLPESVRADIEKSLVLSQYSNPRSVQWRIEAEAMALEETPDQVILALQQYCK